MKLRLSTRARDDLEDIAAYLRSRDPQAARRVERQLAAALRSLVDFPQSGRPTGRGLRRFVVPHLPYLIFYRIDVEAQAVAVATIRHTARRPLA